ncbi:MAG: two-component system response regulator [Nostocales cyanobacterium 94392]|nr:two-component system response regulator [Nostocales cyanobacterium 94392]
MIQWKSNYTGSTEQKVSGSNPTTLYNRADKNHALTTESEPHTEELSNPDLKVKETDNNNSSNYVRIDDNRHTNSTGDRDSQVSTKLQVKGYPLSWVENDVPKVLVVDDHVASRMTAVALLGMEGYEVIEADNGSAAVHLVSEKQPDLILLDVMMPEMDGFEVCELLKQDEQTRLIPVIFITALNDRRSRIRGIEVGADDFLSKPFDRVELAARVKSLVRQKRLNEDLDHAEKALFSIARAIESRDPNTGDHCERLVNLGKAFGEYLGLSRNQIRDLMWGGYLHDIGKVGIPDSVLLKKGKLTAGEWEVMRQHVLIGERICQPLRSMQGVIPIIRSHHERWDGSGYPDGLKQDQIPFLAQVFQIIDIYDALTSERPYKKAFTPSEALSIITEETNKGWRNPKLIQHFTEFISTINHSYL